MATNSKSTFSFNESGYINDFVRVMGAALDRAAKKAQESMQENLLSLGLSGRPIWNDEVASAINIKKEDMAERLARSVGLTDKQNDKFFMIRARILEYGTGTRGDPAGGGSGNPVQHVQGVAGLNSGVTGYNDDPNALAKVSYLMPDQFNRDPNHWFKDACVKIDEIFSDEVESAFSQLNPLKYMKLD